MPALLLCIALLLAQPTGAFQDDDWLVERSEARAAYSHDTLQLENLHGDLRVRPGQTGEVVWIAHRQQHRDDLRVFSVQQVGSSLAVSSREPEQGSTTQLPDGAQRRRIDVTVLIPPAVTVTARTDNGLLEVRGVRVGRLETGGGDLRVHAIGSVETRTVGGSQNIEWLLEADQRASAKLRSRTGAIRLNLPTDVDLRAELRTADAITSDWSLLVERDAQTLFKVARTPKNGVTPPLVEIEMISDRGALSLRARARPRPVPVEP